MYTWSEKLWGFQATCNPHDNYVHVTGYPVLHGDLLHFLRGKNLQCKLFFSFFRKIPDMLILVIYLPPAMLFLISQKIPDVLILVLYLPLTMPLWVVSKNLDMLILGGKYLLFESSRSVKMRGFSFLSLHAFWGKDVYFSIFE